MEDSTKGSKVVVWLALVSILALPTIWGAPVSAQQAGTTLSATKTATGHWTQTFGWSITKAVSPDTLNLRTDETGSAQYQ